MRSAEYVTDQAALTMLSPPWLICLAWFVRIWSHVERRQFCEDHKIPKLLRFCGAVKRGIACKCKFTAQSAAIWLHSICSMHLADLFSVVLHG